MITDPQAIWEKDHPRLHRILERLLPGLPTGQWFLNGSAVLVLHHIKTGRPMGDLDIFLATRPWFDFPSTVKRATGFSQYGWELRTPDPSDPTSRHDPPYWERVIEDLPVNVFFGWRVRHVADIDCNFLTLNAQNVQGWPCAPIQMVLDWKCQKLRGKDSIDVEAIYRRYPELRPSEYTG
jgi:hypothetical protein